MRRNYERCPRCALSADELVRSGGEWKLEADTHLRWKCVGKCGMSKAKYPNTKGDGYTLLLGDWLIYWAFWESEPDHCSIQYIGAEPTHGTSIDVHSSLPFDVGLDTIKLYMTFS